MPQQNKVAYAMTRAAVEKGIQDIRDNPRRGIRNLVELGELFSHGRFQRDFFQAAMRQLRSERSAYYRLVERLVRSTSSRTMTSFGMNLGYNCWARGAEQIRELESREGFNIPWCLLFDMEGKGLPTKRIAEIITQGKALGIYCYLFRVDGGYTRLENLLKLLTLNKDCAHFLFAPPSLLNKERTMQISAAETILTAVELDTGDPALPETIHSLRQHRCLLGACACYDSLAASANTLLPAAAELHIPFLFFVNREFSAGGRDCGTAGPPDAIQVMREKLRYPVLPIDLYRDIARIDQNISSEGCVAAVSGDGAIALLDAERGEVRGGCDLAHDTLRDILAEALPKATR